MSTPLTLTTTRRDDGTLLLLASGEIDLSNIDTFTQALTSAAHHGGTVTVDLSAVEYLDSAAINALFSHADHIQNLIVKPLLIPVLTISGLTELVTVDPAPPVAD